MRFLIDAQLPYILASRIKERGFEAIHTDDLPGKDETEDEELKQLSVKADYIIITKDIDFYDRHLLKNIPEKRFLITTGNIKSRQLLELFRRNFSEITALQAGGNE